MTGRLAMALIGFALIKAIINGSRRNAVGLTSTVPDTGPIVAE